MTIVFPAKYIVTVENYNGGCKRVKVLAHSPEDAMAQAQRGGWYPVEVKADKAAQFMGMSNDAEPMAVYRGVAL